MSVWRRPLPPELAGALRGSLDAGAFERDLRDEEPPLGEALRSVPSAARDFLEDDLVRLTRYFSSLTGSARIRFNLSVLRDDRCRKFHIDYFPLRLVTTFSGPGTEWLPDAAVQRSALVDSSECPDTANAAIVRDGRSVRRARPGDVVMLKGAHFSGRASGAAVHRAPPIESSGATRVVLTLTALEMRTPLPMPPPPRARAGLILNSDLPA